MTATTEPQETQIAPKPKAAPSIVNSIDYPDECATAMVVFGDLEQTISSLIGPENALQLARVWLHSMRMSEKLQKCSPSSLAAALMTCAELNLMPGQFGHVYLLPFSNKGQLEVTPIVGYKGFLELARRSGEILEMVANVVYKDELDSGRVKLSRYPAEVVHPFIPTSEPRNDDQIAAAYCLIRTKDGGRYVEILDRSQIDARRARSKSGASSSSPWNSDFARMARKSAIRALFSGGAVPMSSGIERALALEGQAVEVIDAGDLTPKQAPPQQASSPIRGALGI